MKRLVSRIALLGLLLALPALAAEAAAQQPVTLKFHGSLRDGLAQLAKDGHLNLMVVGKLDEVTDLYFDSIPAQDALQSIAKTYGLSLEQNGKVWTLRPGASAATSAPAVPPLPALPPLPMVAPVPPVPPVPPSSVEKDDDEEKDDEGKDSDSDDDDAAEDTRSRIEDIKDKARDLSEQIRERIKVERDGNREAVGPGTVTVDEGQSVKEAVSFGGSVVVNGHVEGDAVAFGGTVTLGPHAEVDGDVTAFGGTVKRDPGAKVHGDVTEFGGNGLHERSHGRHDHDHDADSSSDRHDHEKSDDGGSFLGGIPWFLLKFAIYFGLSFLFSLLAPSVMARVKEELVQDAVKCGLVGLAGSVAAVPLTVLLVITLVGIPIAFVLWIGVVLAVLLGFSVVSAELGARLPFLQGRHKTQASVLAVGILTLMLVGLIPFVGSFVLFVVAVISLGAVVQAVRVLRPRGFPEPV